MRRDGALQIVKDHPVLFVVAGMLGFGVNVLSLWVIRLASSLSLKVRAHMVCSCVLLCVWLGFLCVYAPVQSPIADRN